ncbi:PIN domain nuclease of toxin-antitoxin system [Roseiarcus fermentans]|uniref:Ribonuclease VapC n=1 Tax=Roseiarcus fermentans TaxID=1473586 RepID=A0A366FTQ6_9HYPH|nr:type II toxin-antitoxin system VapC family toxin [Roseiarcus fermentans]RBP18063.1 PIN domain nuclease of toxin-antitoxin system [Roseiarcus fermentans]
MRFVLDASALLAALNGEPGADRVAASLDAGVVSAVNFAEVAGAIARGGNSADEVRAILTALACPIIPADEEMAVEAGLMRALTARAGLSLGDRFCLALGRRLRAPVLTADRRWALIADDVGVTVELIR